MRLPVLAVLCGMSVPYWLFATEGVVLQRVPADGGEFGSRAVVVERGRLLHTTQFPTVSGGDQRTAAGIEEELQRVWTSVKGILNQVKADEADVVRLNISLLNSSDRERVLQELKEIWGEKGAPAVSFVQGKLPVAGTLIALDAIVAVPEQSEGKGVEQIFRYERSEKPGVSAAILPGRHVIHIAGQAEKGKDVRECARNTLTHLKETLEWRGVSWKDAVSVKCFVTPIDAAGIVAEELKEACGGDAPPVVFVEWESDLPIEIEVVASGVSAKPERTVAGDLVKYLTPPGMTKSPVYSRLVETTGTPIYVSGLISEKSMEESAEVETRGLFRQLKEILNDSRCRSDLKHLVKATYYCSHGETSQALNTVRPDYYDPERPPAASKAIVPGVGKSGRRITMDMIAIRRSEFE